MSTQWDEQAERSSHFWLRLIIGIALRLGRGLARLVLLPVVGYFLLTSGSAQRASRHYLRRVLQREPRWLDVARHFHRFASVSLDRFFFLSGRAHLFQLNIDRPPEVLALSQQRRGCLLLMAHVGSFEVMRYIAVDQRDLDLRMLIDLQVNARFMRIVQKLRPDFAARVIDAAQSGPALVLTLKEALEQNAMVGMMADRARDHERRVAVTLLGGTAHLPAGPWILAASLGVPVILAFGLYRGGDRYDVHLECFADRIALPRATREVALQETAQRYADRLAHHLRSAPDNWFNFYDYWADDAKPDVPRDQP